MVGQTTLDAVMAVLGRQPGLTAAEVAAKAQLGRSTAGKALAELERRERAHRVTHTQGQESGPPQPARWFLPVDNPASLVLRETAREQDAGGPGDGVVQAGGRDDVGAGGLDGAPAAAEGAAEPFGEQKSAPPTDADSHDTAAGDGEAGAARLRKGELRALVLARLEADPDGQHTPSALAKLLGRSSGAIANALVRLCLEGVAVETSSRPRRYSAARRQAA